MPRSARQRPRRPRRRGLCLRRPGPTPTRRVDAPPGYPTHIDVRVGGKAERVPVSYWRKVAIRAGRYVHPETGEAFDVTPERLDRWVRTFQWMRGRGIDVPTPVDHREDTEANRGFVVAAERRGDDLVLTQQAIGRDAALLAARSRCSLLVDDYVDERTGDRREAILHSAYTAKPVVGGCGPFRPFAASRGPGGAVRRLPVYYLARGDSRPQGVESEMKLSKKQQAAIRKALGLAGDAPVGQAELDQYLAQQAGDAGDDDAADDDADAADGDDADGEDAADDDAGGDDSDADGDAADDDDAEADADAVVDKPAAGRAAADRRGGKAPALKASRVDAGTGLLLSRALKTELNSAVRKGGISAAVADELEALLIPANRPTALCLSRVDGSDDPWGFHLLNILKKNKPAARPLNGNGRTGSQHAQALERDVPGSLSRQQDRELKQLRKETAAWARRQQAAPAGK